MTQCAWSGDEFATEGEILIRSLFLVLAGVAAIMLGAAPHAVAQQPYENCSAAARDGRYNIPSDSPYYGPWLDRDEDGIGCEK